MGFGSPRKYFSRIVHFVVYLPPRSVILQPSYPCCIHWLERDSGAPNRLRANSSFPVALGVRGLRGGDAVDAPVAQQNIRILADAYVVGGCEDHSNQTSLTFIG